jgi:hypothetical protein
LNRIRITTVSFLLLLPGLCLGTSGQPAPNQGWPELSQLDPKLRAVVVQWLAQDCEATEERRFLQEFAAIGSRLVPVFQEAYRLGPPPESVDATQTAAREAFEQRQAWLREEGEESLGAEATQRLLANSVEDYVTRQTRSADQGWRERALLALGLVADEKTLAELARIAADPENPAAAAAQRGLEERAALTKPLAQSPF